jgi:predicted phage terminase large subunit-like protein
VNHADQRVLDALLRTNFSSFLHRCFLTLSPGDQFLHNWHIDAIAWQLQRVMAGEVRRLIINLPPRSLKSLTVSVAFPAFLLGLDPRSKIFGVSYSNDLADKHANDTRVIMESGWYRRAFPQLQIARVADSDIYTTQRGFRRSTSIHATLTGLGGNYFVVDDPLKVQDAQSDAQRNSSNEFYSNTMLSRLDNKETGVVIIVMQRVHQDDLTGYLLDRSPSTWTVLNLPAIAEEDQEIQIGPGRVYHRKAGEVLHPARESLRALEELRRELGSDIFSAQYQQAPVPPGGAMIKREWLRYYDPTQLPNRAYPAKIFQSWDTASKNGAQNDYSVCTTLLKLINDYYVLDVTRGRYDYPRLKATAVALAQRYKPDMIYIEDTSTGTPLAQELRKAGVYAVHPVRVEQDKRARVFIQQAKFEAGQVLFPRGAAFLRDLEAELLAFPYGKHDDQVDSLTQALASSASKYGSYDTSMNWVNS